MGYKKKELIEAALSAISNEKLIFIEEIMAYLPCDKATFYRHKCHECDSIKEALEHNKIATKVGLRKKWYDSDNATVQVALYKLIGTEDEADRLNGSKQKLEAHHMHSVDEKQIERVNEIYDRISKNNS